MATIISVDPLRQAVETATGGLCTVLYDSKGNPNYMRRFPKVQIEDLNPDLGLTGTHPAFIVNGEEKDEIFISMYLCTNIVNSCAVALPSLGPANSVNFDFCVSSSIAKGVGWHLMTNAEWSLVQMTCLTNDFIPHGNTYGGKDRTYQYEYGTLASGQSRTLTGTGPVTWRHDNSLAGVSDLIGNVYESCSGFRINNGEIQIMANNDAALSSQDHSASSSAWKAVLQDGSLVSPGTTDTLKFDSINPDGSGVVGNAELSTTIINSTSTGNCQQTFSSLYAQSGITVPPILKLLGIMPYTGVTSTDVITIKNVGERMPNRGGFWYSERAAGLWSMALTFLRSYTSNRIGFRFAFIA